MAIFDVDSRFNSQSSFSKVRFGELSDLLEVDLNELQDVQNFLRIDTIRKLFTSGFLAKGSWQTSGSPAENRYGNNGGANRLYIGRNVALVNGNMINVYGPSDNHIQLNLPSKPSSGTRTDLVFLEVWTEKVDYQSTLYKYGGEHSGTIPNEILDPRWGAEHSQRHQLRWRYRAVSGVDFDTYPLGINDPTVKAKGGASSNTAMTFSVSSQDSGLFIAGTGSESDKTTLNTVDGYVLAIPMFKITRDNSNDAVTQSMVEDLRIVVTTTRVVDGTTNTKGIVQLSTSVSSTSTTMAATPSAVKQAYDLAKSASDGLLAHKHDASDIISGIIDLARLPSATGSSKGVVQLNNSVTSTSTSQAATANAVKMAYDLADTARTSINTHTTRTDNPHNVTAHQVGAITSVGGISNPGGGIDVEVSGDILEITKDNTGKKIVISTKPIDTGPHAHKHAIGGEDPLTPSAIGAVSKSGDTMTGNLSMQSSNEIRFGNKYAIRYNPSLNSLDIEMIT